MFEIPYYHDFISRAMAAHLLKRATPVAGIDGLFEVDRGGGLETKEALEFLLELYTEVKGELGKVLAQRILDRKFIDDRVRACFAFNREMGREIDDKDYATILGLEDAHGRIVAGAKRSDYARAGGSQVAPLPEFLKGPHVTLFGPPDSAKMAINAMNAYHRKMPSEPAIVAELLGSTSPMWGADDEDSKTPLRSDLVDAAVNLSECFAHRLKLEEGGKSYSLASDHLSLPIKRFPGLALPASFLFYHGNPIPLHLYDFALHLFHNWNIPHALTFYVPKLENEEEARYIHHMIATAERMLQRRHPEYKAGTVRLMIVLENPRAILRTHEIIDALYPYFAGASLGWHDYLASTARLFKEDGNYRIPVKADPDIVIKYIKASHALVADVVGSRGGIKVGGMYGILPLAGHAESLQVTLKGFIKDVITQMKRDLTGFWVAHPDFVRIGLALVEGWKRRVSGDPKPLGNLVGALLDPGHAKDVHAFIDGPDIKGLDVDDAGYVRSLIVADIKESDFIANNHPDEIRYNLFQTLQYLTDWLSGNGCVALPTTVNGVPVRVMDDLATAERSRWEVWHELRHGRFALDEFLRIAHEEMNFIRRDRSNDQKIVQVKWDERTEKWYPIAFRLMIKLMTDREPVEFASELLLPFTVEEIRQAKDPWAAICAIDPEKFRGDRYVEDFNHYFEICGETRFAREMALRPCEDPAVARDLIRGFSLEEIVAAADFHGNIGDAKKVLDRRAASEQARVLAESDSVRAELRALGEEYRARFGVKFLISAQGKSAQDMLAALRRRMGSTLEEELNAAREALWEISQNRMANSPQSRILKQLEALRAKHGIAGVSLAFNHRGATRSLSLGDAIQGKGPVRDETRFEIASLSKMVAAAFALEYFGERGISIHSSVNSLLAKTPSKFRLSSEAVTVAHLLNHTALNMHYVKGFRGEVPPCLELLTGGHGYAKAEVIAPPGSAFHYSGAGFLVLQHLLESLESQPIERVTQPFLTKLGLTEFTFKHSAACAHGYFDSGAEVPGGRLNFPAFAAGAFASSRDVARFLLSLSSAYRKTHDGPIAHDTAVTMLRGRDLGARDFMGADIGLGIFTAEAGRNRIALHQGANEGFRALCLQCFDGPDSGEGLVILCNGDNRGVLFITEATQLLLRHLGWEGIDAARFKQSFDYSALAQEQIVNLGYKDLILSAFAPDLPEEITLKGPRDPLSDCNLATRAKILKVTNQKFARAENLLSPFEPVFDPELFGRQGKIMDSWESARHNPLECDRLWLALERPAQIRYLSLSTKFHDGNHAEFVRLLGAAEDGEWHELLAKTALSGHSLLETVASSSREFSKICVEMYPDGGFTRLGLFSELAPETAERFQERRSRRFGDPIPKTKKPLTIPYAPSAAEIARNLNSASVKNIANAAFGAKVASASNEHYGPAAQVISPFPPLHMFDGLESARSREPGHDEEVVIKLAKPAAIAEIELDFSFFVNNNPVSVSLLGGHGKEWVELVAKTEVKAFAGNQKRFKIRSKQKFELLKVITYPDGGINRIKVFEASAY